MTTRFIDTNIFIESYVREGEKSHKCQELLEAGKHLSTSWLVLGEFEWVLRSVYELSRAEIAKLITSIVNLEGLEIPSKKVIVSALKLFKESNCDWADCLNASMMQSHRQREVYSYDHDFDKFPGLKRLEP